MILAGRLADWSVPDLLQIMRITNKTGSLEIEGPMRKGVIYFREGKIVGARLDPVSPARTDQDLRDTVIEAVYVLQLLQDGTFAVGDVEIDDVEVDWDPSEILDAAQTQLEVEGEIRRDGIDDDTPLRLVRRVSEPVMLTPDEWAVIAELASSFSLAELEWRLGRIRAVSAIRSFHEAGVIETVEEAAEAPTPEPPPAKEPAGPEVSDPDPVPEAVSSSGADDPADPAVAAEPAATVEPAVSVDDEPAPVEAALPAATAAEVPEAVETPDPTEADLDGVAGERGVDDEARLLAEASGRVEVHLVDDDLPVDDTEPVRERKSPRAVVSEETVLVPGVLSELNRRFRLPEDEE